MPGGAPVLATVQKTGGEPLAWVLEAVKSEGPLQTQQGLL